MVKKYSRVRYSFKKIAANYTYCRIDVVDRLGAQGDGYKFITANSNSKSLEYWITHSADWLRYAEGYHSFKLKGVAIDVVPGRPSDDFATRGTYLLGLLPNRESIGFERLSESKACLVLGYTEHCRRYYSFNGGDTGWLSTGNLTALDSNIVAETQSLPSAGQMVWSVKLSFYILLKNPK